MSLAALVSSTLTLAWIFVRWENSINRKRNRVIKTGLPEEGILS